jgi:tetratricopeptide (TPR) repeat protein
MVDLMPILPLSRATIIGSAVGRAEVLIERGRELQRNGRADDAIKLYKRALELDPINAALLNDLGTAYGELNDNASATEFFNNALRIDPDYWDAWINRGIAASIFGYFDDSATCFERAIALQPEKGVGYFRLGGALFRLGRFQESLDAFDRCIVLMPSDPGAACNRGASLQALCRFEEAFAEFDRAIALLDAFPWAWLNKSLLLLLLGDLPAGFNLYERRWNLLPNRVKHSEQPLWLGEPDIAGKTLLLHWEQGFGDTLQFARYATIAAQAGARVILEVQKPMVEVMKTLKGVSLVVPQGEPLPDHDFHAPLGSLPLAFGTTLETIPAEVPYLTSDAARAAAWRERISHIDGYRIGLVWAGMSRDGNPELVATDRRRSMALAALGPLGSIPGCAFFSLQLGPPSEQETPAGLMLHDFTSHLSDFAETAALIANLDLVIAVDTSVVHLAGAMGKPVWMLNRFDTCWRWLLDRDDSPWYPTLRQFRQTRPGDWAGVVERVAKALRERG